MNISEFDYDLPSELIAREPAEPRGASRMLVLNAGSGHVTDSMFHALPELLKPDDVLVINDTKVIRARTRARLERQSGTSREIEIFFAEPVASENAGQKPGNLWKVLCKPGRRIRAGDRAVFGNGEQSGIFRDEYGADLHVLELDSAEAVENILEQFGQMPLPPYIDRAENPADEENYQTVFAAHSGAVAAPTAGLHFTNEVLASVRSRGISIVTVTLHVGIGTFLPIRTDQVENHILHPERFEIPISTAEVLSAAHREGRRVVAVGTTTTRTLEFLMQQHGEIPAGAGKTDLYILPGFQFRIVGALLTNFHLPKSTLLMLVSAFGGIDAIRKAYRHAIEERYRFYSYGDCMFIQR